MKMSKVKSADSVVHQFLRVLSKPSQAPKCHWSNCDCPKNPKETHKLRPECWWECHKTSDPTSSQVIHQTIFSSNLFTQKANDTNQGKWRPKEWRAKKKKKKIKKKKKKIRLSTEETGKWLTSWAYVLIQTHCPCRTITIHLTDILVGRFVLEYQDRLGDAELQQAITQRYHNTK